MRYIVLGAGAIGGYVGGSLAAAGLPVTFVARPRAAAALRERGLRLTPGPGEATRTLHPVVATSLAEALREPADLILLAVKAYDTPQALADLRAVTATPPPCVCLQNGVDAEAEVAQALGAAHAIAATVTTAVSVPGTAEVAVEKRRGVGVALGQP
jgi:2-dehydropantoate 2-reductase